MTEEDKFLTRRTVLRSGAVTATVGAVGAGAAVYGSQPALAAETDNFTAANVSAQADQYGEIQYVTIDPSITLDWSNFTFEEGITSTDMSLVVDVTATTTSGESSTETALYDVLVTASAENGTETSSPGQKDIIANGSNITVSDFPEGETTTVDVAITVTVDNTDLASLNEDLVAEAGSTFDVTVQEGSEMTEISGSTNSDAE